MLGSKNGSMFLAIFLQFISIAAAAETSRVHFAQKILPPEIQGTWLRQKDPCSHLSGNNHKIKIIGDLFIEEQFFLNQANEDLPCMISVQSKAIDSNFGEIKLLGSYKKASNGCMAEKREDEADDFRIKYSVENDGWILKLIYTDSGDICEDSEEGHQVSFFKPKIPEGFPPQKLEVLHQSLLKSVKDQDPVKVKYYLDHLGAFQLRSLLNTEYRDVDGKTALILAAEGGDLEILNMILSAGASLKAQDRTLNTAEKVAAIKNKQDVVKALKEFKAQK
jgi:hypothetical protein